MMSTFSESHEQDCLLLMRSLLAYKESKGFLEEGKMMRNQKGNEQGVVRNLQVPTDVLEVNLSTDFLTARAKRQTR